MIREAQATGLRNEAGGGPTAFPIGGSEGGAANDGPSGSESDSDAVIMDEAKLVLAEKRTSMAMMRTGIAVFALPLSVLSLLIATSRYYDVVHVLYLIIPLAVVNVALLALGTHLVARALRQLRRYDMLINRLKTEHTMIGKFLE
jgi:uncharacterized membrane protein YidH (DUF202 family)